MREFNFLGTWKDSQAAIASLLSDKTFSFVLDKWYDTPSTTALSEVTPAVESVLKERRRLFLWSSSFASGPPRFVRQGSGLMAGRYSVDVAYEGPYLDLIVPPCFTKQGKVFLNYGSLSHPRRVYDTSTRNPSRPSSDLIEGFREAKSRIQSHLKRFRGEWTGTDAVRLLKTGEAQRLPNGGVES
jgi:hypothetical protein